MTKDNNNELVCMGIVADSHGVRGAIKIRSYTEYADDIQNYDMFFDKTGKELFSIKIVGHSTKGLLICHVDGITDRDKADAIKGTALYIPRELLPAIEEDEFYHTDLIGLNVEDSTGKHIGKVSALHNFGAGDILEFQSIDGRSEVVQFSLTEVPEVTLETGVKLSRTYQEIIDLRKGGIGKK